MKNYSNKKQLTQDLEETFKEVNDFIESLGNETFIKRPVGKWSCKDQLQHLILSSKVVPSVLKMPKIKLFFFGKSKNGSRTYEQLYTEYKSILNTGVTAPSEYTPANKIHLPKEVLLQNWNIISDKFEPRIDTWSEKELDSYRVLHPALGKITIRELLLSTIFHAKHHLESMKVII